MIRILLVVQEQATGLTYHRQLVPHTNLERNYFGQYEVIPTHDFNIITDEELKEFQVVSFLRLVDWQFRTQDFIYRCKKAGCKVVVDIDDYWNLHPTHELFKKYEENKIPEQTIAGLEGADYVTTTTEHFADKIRQYNKNVIVLPNSVDTTEKQFENKKRDSDRLRFGWIGGIFHIPDVRLMYEGFKEVFKSMSHDKFQMCLGGFGNNDQYKFIEQIYTNEFKSLKSDIYKAYLKQYSEGNNQVADSQPYKRLWGKSVFKYAELYNEIDVALVPLRESNFNSFKSQIKIIEAGFFKKAVIVSNVMPYTIDCNRSNSILISPNKRNDGWGVAMKSMILNPNKVEDLAEKMHETVKDKYNMDNVNVSRHQLYQSICK